MVVALLLGQIPLLPAQAVFLPSVPDARLEFLPSLPLPALTLFSSSAFRRAGSEVKLS